MFVVACSHDFSQLFLACGMVVHCSNVDVHIFMHFYNIFIYVHVHEYRMKPLNVA